MIKASSCANSALFWENPKANKQIWILPRAPLNRIGFLRSSDCPSWNRYSILLDIKTVSCFRCILFAWGWGFNSKRKSAFRYGHGGDSSSQLSWIATSVFDVFALWPKALIRSCRLSRMLQFHNVLHSKPASSFILCSVIRKCWQNPIYSDATNFTFWNPLSSLQLDVYSFKDSTGNNFYLLRNLTRVTGVIHYKRREVRVLIGLHREKIGILFGLSTRFWQLWRSVGRMSSFDVLLFVFELHLFFLHLWIISFARFAKSRCLRCRYHR